MVRSPPENVEFSFAPVCVRLPWEVMGQCPPASDSHCRRFMNYFRRVIRVEGKEHIILFPFAMVKCPSFIACALSSYSGKLMSSRNVAEF